MKAYKKALALFLALALSLSLTSCSQIQAAIGSITGKEDPSVAGNMPAGNHEDEEYADISNTGEFFELYGTKITKREVEEQGSYKVFDLGGGIYSDVHEILVFDENGNELIVFNSGKPAKDYLDNLQIEQIEYGPNTLLPGNIYWATFSFGQLGVYNWTDSEVPIFDLECSTLQISQYKRKNIDIEKLGKPTAACVRWGKYASLGIYLYWKCDGFYIEGVISGMPKVSGDSYEITKFNLARFNASQQLTAYGTSTTTYTGSETFLSMVADEFGWNDIWIG